jgi:glucosamine-6-phosphate deaminase
MKPQLCATKTELGQRAAQTGAQAIRDAIRDRGAARIILATGVSQFELLEALTSVRDIDWSKVTAFHLDEYVGMPETHPASFRRYLRERFIARVPPLAAFHLIAGDAEDVRAEIARVSRLITQAPIDVCFAGIGENAHLAFNDPPADFETEQPYLEVTLDDACRRQQFGEGWFETLADVPTRAISMSVRQILASRFVVLSVADRRKAAAVRAALQGPIAPAVPASILQTHPNCVLFLDPAAASALES